jgi:transcriptional regulator with XRE-family HTH domain
MAALADTPWPDAPRDLLAARCGAFGRRVGVLRIARGWTGEGLALRAGISRRNLHDLERGDRMPTPDTGTKLADAFGLAGAERVAFLAPIIPRRQSPVPAPGAFGLLLRRYRERAGLSMSALARQTACDASIVARYESSDRTHARRDMVLALAAALALTAMERDELLAVVGHAPAWATDRTVQQVAALLDGDAVLATALRCQVAALWAMVDEGDEG